jgi:hypothetical protein
MAKKDIETTEPTEVATDPIVTIDLDGGSFFFPRDQDEWPTGAILAAARVQSGRAEYDDVVEALLGADQWARLTLLPFREWKKFLRSFSDAMDEINAG